MKEIARIVSGLIALRIVQDDDDVRRCERFESGVWVEFTGKSSPPVLSADVKHWLAEHYTAQKQFAAPQNIPSPKKGKRKSKAQTPDE